MQMSLLIAAQSVLDGALEGAIIGGIVGALAGVGLWVARLLRGQGSKKDDPSEPPDVKQKK